MNGLDKPVTYLKGVGEQRAKIYERLGIFTVHDLLYHFPRGYTDLSHPKPLEEAENGEQAVIFAVIVKKFPESRIRRGFSIFKAQARDLIGDGDLLLTFFNNPYAFAALKENESYLFYGKIGGDFLKREINSPIFIKPEDGKTILPNYPLTAGLSVNMLRRNEESALKILERESCETLPDDFRQRYNLIPLDEALQEIHFPQGTEQSERAARRLAFDELMLLQLGLLAFRGRNREQSGCIMKKKSLQDFLSSLPFSLTGAQQTAINEICADLCKEVPMNRLLQGDVGSGKTVVAAAACVFSHKNGFQSALMAPTELLAEQHFNTLRGFLSPLGISVCLLTGSITKKEKSNIKALIKSGEIAVVVGTHALIQKDTEFARLGLVIADEQHRFGVAQREALAEKGTHPHKLVMSATPIPRTLSLIIYGDLDISVINELPKGRIPIETFGVTGKLRQRVMRFADKQIENGRQVYIVCPVIDENESELLAAAAYSDELREKVFPNRRIGLLHGRMNQAEKSSIMRSFREGELDILVCTTIVEVGVDVPNATVMIIENAERFGLSQLHQLRGRIGRGSEKSYCILITDSKGDEAVKRVKILCSTTDGFKISEEDLRLRGPGDFFGQRQHGLPELKIASLTGDMQLVNDACHAAKEIYDKGLERPENRALNKALSRLFAENGSFD